MPNLREHAKDVCIGAISQAHCEQIAELVERHARKLRNPVFRYFYPGWRDAKTWELVASALARVKGVPEPLPAQFDVQVAMAMGKHQP